MNEKVDVVVVGAGPAGSTAARAAAESGAKVLLLEKSRELGVPVQCGEAIGEKVLRDEGLDPEADWVVHKTHSTRAVAPSGTSFLMSTEKGSGRSTCILDRSVFDRYLALAAVEAGADIRMGTLVDGLLMEGRRIVGVKTQGPSGHSSIHARVTIAADGVMSRVSRWARLPVLLRLHQVESCVQFRMVGIELESADTSEFFLGEHIVPGGFAWIFPKGRRTANVGLGVLPSRAARPALAYLNDFVRSRPGLENGKITQIHAGAVPVCGPARRSFTHGLMAVGDAARHVHALDGGGIDYALKSGAMAGKIAGRAVALGDASPVVLGEYEQQWKAKYGKSLDQYQKARKVIDTLTDANMDELVECLQGMRLETISAREFLKLLIKKHPRLLWKLRKLL
jgi:digeranylgeranylglycerophospholipid reductase